MSLTFVKYLQVIESLLRDNETGVTYGLLKEGPSTVNLPPRLGIPRLSFRTVILVHGTEPLHLHKCHKEIIICASGYGELFYEDELVELSKNKCFVMEENIVHGVRATMHRLEYHSIVIPSFDKNDFIIDPRGRNWGV